MRDSALFAIVAAAAAYVVAPQATPIDRALPFVVLLLAVAIFTTEGAEGTEGFVPFVPSVVILPAIFFTDEHTRLLAYGVVAAIAFALAEDNAITVIAGVLLLRWIPFSDVVIWRELIVLGAALAVYAASRSALIAIAVALLAPIFPGRLMVLPFVAAAVFAFLPRIRVPAVAAVALFAMWPWSGIVARALPAFLRARPAPEASRPVWIALAPGESVSIDAPASSQRAVITASGANAARLRRGTLMGTADGVAIRIGDISDFGYTRRELFWRSRNAAPRVPLDDVKGYGQSAWLHTAGLIAVPVRDGAIRISAARDLPGDARLQIEAVAFE